MKRILWILVVLFFAAACSKSTNFEIEGTISNAPEGKAYLQKLLVAGPVPFDSCKLGKDGSFKFKGTVEHPTFFLLKFANSEPITLLVDSAENIEFSADYLDLFSKNYKVEGSQGSEKVQQLVSHQLHTTQKLDSIYMLIQNNQGQPFFDERLELWNEEIERIYNNQIEFSTQFVRENPFSMASVLALYQRFNNGNYIVQDLQAIRTAASALNSFYPTSEHVMALYQETTNLIKRTKNEQLKQLIAEHGSNSPEIVLPNTQGTDVALSSLQGKVVLVQFWSAKDKASRIMNEVLAENYAQFKSKGFEIYQVSVDTDRKAWIDAIAEDNLKWTQVGDMEGSISAVNFYNIQSIPANYLLNRKGEIVGKNLKGPALHSKLSEILN